jgi:hypothetical protein
VTAAGRARVNAEAGSGTPGKECVASRWRQSV